MNLVSTVIGDFLRKINTGKINIPVPIILVHPKNNFATLTWWGEHGFFRIDAVKSRFNFEFGIIAPEIDYSWMESVFFENSIDGKEKEISACIQQCLAKIGHVS
jgi:hypothetical protein